MLPLRFSISCIKKKTGTLEQFIYDYQPFKIKDSTEFRASLASLIKYIKEEE